MASLNDFSVFMHSQPLNTPNGREPGETTAFEPTDAMVAAGARAVREVNYPVAADAELIAFVAFQAMFEVARKDPDIVDYLCSEAAGRSN